MRQSLVKQIRRQAKNLFDQRPYVEYTTHSRGYTVMTDFCIKKVVKDTKKDIKNATGKGLFNL